MSRAPIIEKVLIGAALTCGLLGPASATRVLELLEDAYELRLENVLLPQSTAGHVIFKTCADCDQLSLNVSASTAYFVGGSAVPLADLIQAADGYRRQEGAAENTAVYVYYDVESGGATRIVLDYLGASR